MCKDMEVNVSLRMSMSMDKRRIRIWMPMDKVSILIWMSWIREVCKWMSMVKVCKNVDV